MEGFFKYNCEFWNDFDNRMEKKNGIVFAERYSEAIEKIEKYYGGDTINSISIVALEPSEVYEFD